jgi:hypothetical protein
VCGAWRHVSPEADTKRREVRPAMRPVPAARGAAQCFSGGKASEGKRLISRRRPRRPGWRRPTRQRASQGPRRGSPA